MTIVGCDFHPSWQQVAVFETERRGVREVKLRNGNGEAEPSDDATRRRTISLALISH